MFDERARTVGAVPVGERLKPRVTRAMIGGTIDDRLSQGRLAFHVVLCGRGGAMIDVHAGRTDGEMRIFFGADFTDRASEFDPSAPDADETKLEGTVDFHAGTGFMVCEHHAGEDADFPAEDSAPPRPRAS